MVKPEWGAKRICHSCGAPFYDLNRNPVICPKCGVEYDSEAILKSRRSRLPLQTDKEALASPIDDDIELAHGPAITDDAEDDAMDADVEGDEDDELIEDPSELGKDEDDMAEVMENVGDVDER